MMNTTYDYIVTGGGAAGRSFVSQLLKSSLRNKRVLLIDREPKRENDRTWCFWEREAGFFEEVVWHRWNHLWVHTDDFSRLLDIAPYTYKLIRGVDFYQYTDELIDQHPNVERLYGEVEDLSATDSGVAVRVNGQQYTGEWAFNSIFFGKVDKTKVNYLDQHFRGWFLRSATDVFDPGRATLMDFRTDQRGETRFLYVLPYNAREALVEVAIFSNDHLAVGDYDRIIKEYMRSYLPDLTDFEIIQTEMGNIPMTDYPFQTSNGRVIHLGMAGGDTRASSGYTFLNIQKRVAAIVTQLVSRGHPVAGEPFPLRRARFYDKLLLCVLEKGYYPGAGLFRELFSNNSPATILAFLNAETRLLQEVRLASSLPNLPFLKALLKEVTTSRSLSTKPNLPRTDSRTKASRNSI